MTETDRPPDENEEWTCGRGLAHHSAIPAKMARFLAALTEVLRTHLPTIDTEKSEGRAEWEAYDDLVKRYASLAEELGRTAGRMSGYRDLPSAPHHEESLADPAIVKAFSEFVEVEAELAEMLRKSAGDDLEMLRGWERAESSE